jgi:hypothetical protein
LEAELLLATANLLLHARWLTQSLTNGKSVLTAGYSCELFATNEKDDQTNAFLQQEEPAGALGN